MESSGKVMARLSGAIVDIAAREGQDLGDVLERFAIEPERLRRSDAYVPVEAHELLWQQAALRTGREAIGVFAALSFTPGLTGVVEYLLRNCATVGDAAQAWQRFAPLVSPHISGALLEEDETIYLCWRLSRPDTVGTRHWAEFAQGRTLEMIRQALAAPQLSPLEVWFRHAAPQDLSLHHELFAAPLRFNQHEHALIWPREWLETPLVGIDSEVRHALEGRAQRLATHPPGSLAEACRHAVRASLRRSPGAIRLDEVARGLGLSARSLQRKLGEQGASFQRLLDETRRELAEELLETLSTAEVAERLGYSDDAAFRKARRRWATRG